MQLKWKKLKGRGAIFGLDIRLTSSRKETERTMTQAEVNYYTIYKKYFVNM